MGVLSMRLKALIAGAATARDSYSLVQFIGHCTVLLLRCASLAHADNISIKINRDKTRPRGMVHKLPFITVHLHGRHDTQTLLCRWGLLKRFEAEETPLPPATLVLSMPGALNGHQQRTFGSLLGTYSLVAGREAHGRPVSVCLCVCVSASCVASCAVGCASATSSSPAPNAAVQQSWCLQTQLFDVVSDAFLGYMSTVGKSGRTCTKTPAGHTKY